MNDGLIPHRYAKALYELAVERHCDSELYDLLKNLEAAFKAAPALQSTLANPFASIADKRQLIFTAAGADAARETTLADFIKLLDKNHRIDMVRQIALAYLDIYRKANDIHTVTLESASQLPDGTMDKLKALIARHLGKVTMELNTAVNPDLIGGFRISIGNEVLDASVANELQQLKLALSKTV